MNCRRMNMNVMGANRGPAFCDVQRQLGYSRACKGEAAMISDRSGSVLRVEMMDLPYTALCL